MKSRISGRISKKDKDKIRILVEKKAFPSMSEFYRVAISRLLKDLEHARKMRIQRPVEKTEEKGGEELKELVKLIDDVY